MSLHKLSLVFLYCLTLIVAGYLTFVGWDYYSRPLHERARHELHEEWKPSGFVGRASGIAGSTLMVMLLLYSLRKRWRFMKQGWGDIRYWLNYHIWMGVTGPVLIIYHTSFKFGGIVAVSFWSMVAVALSGVIGRYIYVQIPRSLSGEELSSAELLELDAGMRTRLSAEVGSNSKALALLSEFDEHPANQASGFMKWLLRDLTAQARYGNLRSRLVREAGVDRGTAKALAALAKKRALLDRRIAFLGTARQLLHHWHVFHKPFAIIMLVIMVVHIVVDWVF